MNIRNIRFEFEIECNGIVNWDGNEQKENFKKCYSGDESIFYNKNNGKENKNFKFGKANYDYDEDYNLVRYPKISSDCIRHHLFGKQQHTPTLTNNGGLLTQTIAHPLIFLRGYLWPDKQCIKRASSISITDAIAKETSTDVDTHICKQIKFVMDDDNNVTKDSTTIYHEESRGPLIYKGEGSIDLDQISFVSFSQYHDRQAILCDHENLYIEKLKNQLEDKKFNLQLTDEDLIIGNFTKYEDAYKIPERGCKLSNKIIGKLVIDILKRLCTLYIEKGKARAKMKKVVITLIDYPFNFDSSKAGVLYDNEKFSNILNDIENATFYNFYTQDMRSEDEIQKEIKFLAKATDKKNKK